MFVLNEKFEARISRIEASVDEFRETFLCLSSLWKGMSPDDMRILLRNSSWFVGREGMDFYPLHAAILYSSSEVLAILIDALQSSPLYGRPAYPTGAKEMALVHSVRHTPLSLAAQRGDPDICKLVISKGLLHSHGYLDELITAMRHGNSQVVDLFIVNMNGQDGPLGSTAIEECCRRGDTKTLKKLIRSGYLNKWAIERGNALNCAVRSSLDCVRLLLEKGIDVNKKDAFGSSPLEEAIVFGGEAVVEYLIDRGAKISSAGPDRNARVKLEELLRHRAKMNLAQLSVATSRRLNDLA